jgi:twinkle protein
MIDAKTVKERLLSNVESVCFYLFPKGKVRGHEFLIGSPAGEEGSSMTINLRGDKRGVWRDHATMVDKGDIFDLWCAAKQQDFKTAFPEICRYLGMNSIDRPKPKPRPAKPDTKDVHPMSGTPELKYLTEKRGLHPETLKTYRVRTHRRPSEHNEHFVCFQFVDTEGEPVMLKSTGIKPTKEGKKDIWTTQPFYTLWGWWLVKPSDRSIIITEGEYDAMSVHQLDPGMPVLSLPSGCSNMDWIENDYDALMRFERIYVMTDRDEPHPKTGLRPGEEAAKAICKRLGLARCYRVVPPEPFKDANDALTKGEPEQLEVSAWLARAFSYDPPTLRGAKAFADDVKNRLRRERQEDAVNTFVFPDFPFQLRDGECTLCQGYPGHGKSELTYQVFLHEMASGHKTCIASAEIGPDEMIVNLATQFLGKKPDETEVDRAIDWLDGRLWFVSNKDEDMKSWAPLFEDFKYAGQRFGCTRFVVDSLMFFVKKDDYEGQDQFAKACRNFTRANTDAHLWLLAHSAIKKGEDKIPAMSDVLGSAGILAPFNNILTVWRNVEKEAKINEAREGAKDESKIEELGKLHDGFLIVCKQRRTGKRPRTKLWFDPASKTFRTKQADVVPPVADTAPALPLKNDEDQPF